MARSLNRFGLAAAAASAVLLLASAAPAWAAPSRAELEQSVIQLENELADALRRLRTIEEATGGGAAESLQSQLQAIQSELARVVGDLEEARYQNAQLRNNVRTLVREMQLRDAEIAEKLGLEPAFTGVDLAFQGAAGAAGLALPPGQGEGSDPFANPFLEAGDGAPAFGESTAPADGTASERDDPAFFGDDPFAEARAAAQGTLGVRPPLPDDPQMALDAAKRLMVDGRLDDAEAALAEFQQRFGDTPQAGEALYWLGETRFARDQFEEAKNLYIDSLRADPSGPRAADAMIALASSLENMDLATEACSTLASFPTQYPNAALSVRSKAERVRQAAGCR